MRPPSYRSYEPVCTPALCVLIASGYQSLTWASNDSRDAYVVQGTGASGLTVTLVVDAESGLLVFQIRYVESPVDPAINRR